MTTDPTIDPAIDPAIDSTLARAAGLDAGRLEQHQKRILAAVHEKVQTSIPILKACTVNNGGVVPWKAANQFGPAPGPTTRGRNVDPRFARSSFAQWRLNHCVACIPAAGAASRYLGDLQKLVKDAESLAPFLAQKAESFLRDPPGPVTLKADEARPFLRLTLSLRPSDVVRPLAELLAREGNPVLAQAAAGLADFLARLLSTGHAETTKPDLGVSGALWSDDAVRSYWGRQIRRSWERGDAAQGAGTAGVATSQRDKGVRAGVLLPKSATLTTPVRSAGDARFSGEDDDARPGHLTDPGSDPGFVAEGFPALVLKHRALIDAYAAAKVLLVCFQGLPKALVPTTTEGDSFLFLKLAEQMALFPSYGNVLIAPAGKQEDFRAEVSSLGRRLTQTVHDVYDLLGTPFAPPWLSRSVASKAPGPWLVIEQGFALSTIRFHQDGRPYVDGQGRYSPVAAGHGELVHLFHDVAAQFPDVECLHIRNIDNIIGTTETRKAELDVPANLFRLVRDALETLRAFFEDLPASALDLPFVESETVYQALQFLAPLVDLRLAGDALALCVHESGADSPRRVPVATLFGILGNLFHWTRGDRREDESDLSHVARLLARPLSILGVVRKETGDVGGGPVFARLADGSIVKICMEMPHASAEQAEEYFGAHGKATHFNPVLVFFETRTHKRSFSEAPRAGHEVDFRQLFDERFWLLTKRPFEGNPVCYHETVLYELIGNSATANLLFVEVPRTLFNPHKTIFESLGQDRRSYGFDETLKTMDSP